MEAFHRHILDHQATAVVLLDSGLRVAYLNPAAEVLLASSDARSRGEAVESLLRDEDIFARELADALDTQQPFTKRSAELQAPLAAQSITVDYTATPLRDCPLPGLLLELQPLDRVLRINRGVTQRAIQQTTRQLVRGLAHEIKNPLGGIRGAAQLLAHELDRAELRDYTDVIIAEADRLRNLVDRMFGPHQHTYRTSVNVHELIERVRRLLEAESPGTVRIVRDFDPSLPEIQADPEQLVQALLNVARNALEAVQRRADDPEIRLATRAVRQYTIGARRHRLVVRIDVIDNGPGVPPELLDRLFYPMISGRSEGSGLGLSIAQAIVTQHGGLIECDSHPGHTRFSIYLPLEARDDEAA